MHTSALIYWTYFFIKDWVSEIGEIPNYSDTWKISVIILIFEQCGYTIE